MIMQAPMGTANEILQIDAGWSRIETIVAARKIKLARRIMNKSPQSIPRRMLEKAVQLRTEWTRETESLLKDEIPNLPRHRWSRTN